MGPPHMDCTATTQVQLVATFVVGPWTVYGNGSLQPLDFAASEARQPKPSPAVVIIFQANL